MCIDSLIRPLIRSFLQIFCLASCWQSVCHAQLTNCVGGNCPGVYAEPQSCGTLRGRDNAINVLIGGNLTIRQGAEAEGKVVVLGNLTHAEAANEIFNVGYVGAGACVTPDANEDYLVVGGNIISALTRHLIIGSATTTGGDDVSGNLRVKGTISPNNSVIDISGSIITDPTLDLTPFQQLILQTATTSSCLSSHASSSGLNVSLTNTYTGLTISNPAGPDGQSQTFYVNINGNSFPNSAIPVIVDGFDNTDVLIINVSGASPTLAINYFQRDGNVGNAYWNTFRQHILWNFYEASTVNFSSPNTLWEGSIIAPKASQVSINLPGLNGRFITSGDVEINNTGFEFHNYPWEGLSATSTTCTSCNLALFATPSACDPTTNQYSLTGTIGLSNPVSGTLTINNETVTTTEVVNPATTSVSFSLTGLISDGASHTVVVSLPGCGSAVRTYTAPVSCSVAAVVPCSLSATVTAGTCATATNTYSSSVLVTLSNPTAGTLTVTQGASSLTFAVPASSTTLTTTAVFDGLTSDGASHTVVVSLPGCGSAVRTYTAPVSCSVAAVVPCSLSATVTAGACATATNTYSSSVLVTLTNPTAGTLTVTQGASSLTFAVPASSTTLTTTAVFDGLTSDGASHTVVVSLPGCGSAVRTYTAPVSCSVAAVVPCSLSATVTAGACATATNTYSSSVLVTLTNPTAGTLTVTQGASSLTFAVPASSTTLTTTAVFDGLLSDGASHTVVVSLPGCGSAVRTYTAPVSCSVAAVVPCSLSATVTAGACATATNTYSSSVLVTLSNPTAGTLTVTQGASSLTFAVPASSTTLTTTAVFDGLLSDGASHTVVVSLPGCGSAVRTYTAPVSCSVAAVVPCSLSATVTAGACATATNTYSSSVLVTLSNPTAGTLTVTQGASSLTFAVPASSTTLTTTAVFDGLTSDGASHTVVVSLPGCGSAVRTYTAPVSCSVSPAKPVLTLTKRVNKSIAEIGDLLTYTIVLTNTGSASAINVIVTDSISRGISHIANSYTAPVGTSFTQGTPISSWRVPGISPNQSLTLTFQARVDSSGILYNTAMVPGDTAMICTSVPTLMCPGDKYLLTAPAGHPNYRWFKDGVLITNQTSNELIVDAPGVYSLEAGITNGPCPALSCCPFIVKLDTLPNFNVNALAATCRGQATQNNGQLVLSQFKATHTYQYSLGSTFNPKASLSGPAKAIPANGIIASTLENPTVATAYTVRVYNQSGCFTDITVMLLPTVCGCPADICTPFVIQQTKRARRIGDPIR